MASLNAALSVDFGVPDGFEPPLGLGPIASFVSLQDAESGGLALLAMGCAYWLILHEGHYVLCVGEPYLAAAQKELLEWSKLGHSRPVVVPHYAEIPFGALSFVLYAVVLIVVFALQGRFGLVEAGRVDAIAMIEGAEWWRAWTALTLHADVVHLVSNLVAGIGFMCLVARFFGAPLGWALALLSGGFGNVLNAWVYAPDPHLSIGASTGVFAALGILTGVGVWTALKYPESRLSLPRWLLPSLGGLTLLGLLGVGEGPIDVAAHISGFLCGACLGFVAVMIGLQARQNGRMWCFSFSVILLATAWSWGLFAASAKSY